ncbi:uncharacterized protein LOC130099790 [Rhinichthys klamathensis goyatoka]|uniref:uncharacterized protein LOC130099790 n=1 Tax=Rhinichthys klamathensis goyatoka TaxID=3034132 RepID=UPI0024B53308|nr:uncharacterized protein LOC130099790 [Rhinichthys klamathensis goyatoka]
MDEKKMPHLCSFALTKINAGEEIVYDYGDPNCPCRQKTCTSTFREIKENMESRWKNSFVNLDLKPGVMKIDDLIINTEMKIANGCNAAEIFPGVFNNCKVAVKRVAKHVSKTEMEMAHFLSSKNVQAEHLLQHMSVLEDTYFAYFVSPLCEYSLMELIENKDFPERKSLIENRRLEICQLLQGLQELNSYGILHRDLKPENILFDINNKLYIADFGASRKLDLAQTTLLSQMAGSFSWSSFEDVGGMQYKYKKESDIQVAGCLVHYILTDGQHPYQTTTPYSKDPFGLSQNVKMGNFILQCEETWTRQKYIISRMLSKSIEERPTIEECLQSFTSDHRAAHLRLSMPSIRSLIAAVRLESDHGWEREIEVLVFLHWLAHAASYRVVSQAFDIPKTSVVSKAIMGILRRVICVAMTHFRYICFPTGDDLEAVGAGFAQLSGPPAFSRAVGAIDGCHIRIKPPANNSHCYFNRKLFHSIQLQAITDHRGKFLDVIVGYPGSVHDARVLRNSPVYAGSVYPPAGECILGDGGYPCLSAPICLITPYREPLQNPFAGSFQQQALPCPQHRGESVWDAEDTLALYLLQGLGANGDIVEPEDEEDHDDGPPDPHNLEARVGEQVRDNLAAAVSAPNIPVPALQEHDYL